MDRANLVLAEALAEQGRRVHLVAHEIDDRLLALPNVTVHFVPRAFGATLLGERALHRTGRSVAEKVIRTFPDARVVVNGGNCAWPDINWVHCVHSAWPTLHVAGAPLWFRAKSSIHKRKAIADESQAFKEPKLFVANSGRTKQDLIGWGVAPGRIQVVYLGSDPDWKPATGNEKSKARAKFGIPENARVVGFVGALGYDRNKGFDTLLAAFKKVERDDLFVLAGGGGRGLEHWRNEVGRTGLATRVRLIGFTAQVSDVYAASDLLVSPVRYEAYGLNVHEAICRGVPAIVSASAGVAEVYTSAASRFLLRDPESAEELKAKIEDSLYDPLQAQREFGPVAGRLRNRTGRQMAAEIIALSENRKPEFVETRGSRAQDSSIQTAENIC